MLALLFAQPGGVTPEPPPVGAYTTHTLLRANFGGYLAPPDLTNDGDGGAYTVSVPTGPVQSYTGYGGSANSFNNTDEAGGYLESQPLNLPGAFCAEFFLVNIGDNAVVFEVSTTGDSTSASRLALTWEAAGGTFDAPLMVVRVYAKALGGSQALVLETDAFATTAYGAFQHVSLSRDDADLLTFAWGGIARGSATVPGAFSGTARWMSGSSGNTPSGNYIRGPVDSLRLVIGSPVYTSFPFTPSETELAAISGGEPEPEPEPAPSGGMGFEMGGVPAVSFKPLLQRILEERAERSKPQTRRTAKRARTVEIEAAQVALHDGSEEQFRALMQRWLDQMQGLQSLADDEAYRVFMANVAYRINQMREAAEAFERQQQDDEDALIALLM